MTGSHGPDLHGLIAVEMADFHWSNDGMAAEWKAEIERLRAVLERIAYHSPLMVESGGYHIIKIVREALTPSADSVRETSE